MGNSQEREELNSAKIGDYEQEEWGKSTNGQKAAENDSDSDNEEASLSREESKLSPKETLLQGLDDLRDIFGDYSLFDREVFLNDISNILKVLTYEETKEHVLPVLEIYANEQEFLKLHFF